MSAPSPEQGCPSFLRRHRGKLSLILAILTPIIGSLVRDWRIGQRAIVDAEKKLTDFHEAVRIAKAVRNDAFFRIEPDDDRDFLSSLETSRRLLASSHSKSEEELVQKFTDALHAAPSIDGGLAAIPHLQFALGDHKAPRPWNLRDRAERRREQSDRAEADAEKLILIGDSEFASQSSSASRDTYLAACKKIGNNRSDLWEQAHLRLAISYDRYYSQEKSAEVWGELVAYRTQQTHAESVSTMIAKRWLATMLWESGKYEEAEPLMRQPRVFDKNKSLLARPRSLDSRLLIASLLIDNGYEDEALRYANQTLHHFRKYSETTSERFSELLATIGRIHWRHGRLPLAEGYLRNALSNLEKKTSPDINDLANTLGALGGLLSEMGKTEEPAALFTRARDIHQNAPGGPHRNLPIDLYRLGDVLRAPERQKEAGELIQQGIEGLKDRKKHDLLYLAEAHWSLAQWHQRNGRINEAKTEALKAIEISTAAEGAEHRRTKKYQQYLKALPAEDKKESQP